MKLLLVILSASFMLYAELTSAQTDTITYIRGLPQSGEVTDKKDSIDHPPFNKRTNITPEQLPAAIVSVLGKDKLYSGWENGEIQFDKNTKFYHVRIKDKNTVRIYVFSKKGDVVSLDEKNISPGSE